MTDIDKALQAFTQAEDFALSKISSRIESGRIVLGPTHTVLAPIITQLRAQHSESIDRMLRINRLRETAHLKAILEQKLTHVEQQIDYLNEFDPIPRKTAISTMNKVDRRGFYREEERKAKETAEFAKRLAEEQRERRLKRRQEAKELMAAARLAQEEAVSSMQTRKAEALAQLKSTEKAKFEQLAEERRTYMQSIAQLPTRRKAKMTTLHTEPRRGKAIKPENWSEVRQHMEKYDEMKKNKGESESLEAVMRQSHASPRQKYQYNPLFSVLKEEESLEEAAKAQEKAELCKRLELKKRYGVIIKEMYAPTVDPDLRQEVESRTFQLTKGSKSLQSLREVRSERPRPHLTPIKPRANPKETRENDKETMRKPQDYLETMRKRQVEEQGKVIKQLMASEKKPEGLEEREKLAKRLDVLSSEGLNALEAVNKDLLASVRTKLAQVQGSPKPT